MLIYVVYSSLSTRPLAEQAKHDMVERSKRKNSRHGITSVLLHRQGAFLQGIEGEEADVQALYANLCQDPRHDHLRLLVHVPVTRRLFASQSMSFNEVGPTDFDFKDDHLKPPDLPIDLARLNGAPRHFSWQAHLALKLLARYRS